MVKLSKQCWLWIPALISLAASAPAIAIDPTPTRKTEVRVGVLESFPPYFHKDESGRPVGFAIDVMQEVAKRANLKTNYQFFKAGGDAQKALLAGEIDLIPGLGITSVRQKDILFTTPVGTFGISLFVRADTQNFKNLEDLIGHKVAVVNGNAAGRLLARRTDIEQQQYRTNIEALFALLSADVDGLVYPEPVAWKLARDAGISDRIKATGPPLFELKRAIAIQKDNASLFEVLNPVVSRFVASEDYRKIYASWFGTPIHFWSRPIVLVFAGLLFVFALAAMSLWRYRSLVKLNKVLTVSEARFRAMVDNSPNKIDIKDMAGRYTLINREWEKIFGITQEQAIGKTSHELVNNKIADSFSLHDQAVLNFKQSMAEEEYFPLEDGVHTYLTEKFPIYEMDKVVGIGAIGTDITELKKAERAVREHEEFLSKSFRSGPALYSLSAPDSEEARLVDVSQTWLDTFGYSREEVIGNSIVELNLFQNREDRRQMTEKLKKEGSLRGYEVGVRTKDGDLRDFVVAADYIEFGGIRLVLMVSTDITERKRIEQQLHESEERLKFAMQGTTDGIWDWNFETDEVYFSERLETMLGYAVGSFPPNVEPWKRMIHPDDRDRVVKAVTTHLKGDSDLYETEYRLKTKAGDWLWILDRGKVVKRDRDGKALRMVGAYTDISERKHVEEQLYKSEERFRDFAGTAADWFWETDAELRITYRSERATETTGLTDAQVIGLTPADIRNRGDQVGVTSDELHQLLNRHQSYNNFEFDWIRPDGKKIHLRQSAKAIFDSDGQFQGYRGTALDITEAHRLSERLSYQATHDALTGILNRRGFENRLERILKSAKDDDADHALCYLDLDQFKVINDTCGHVAGDELLRQLARLLPKEIRKRDTIARLGGDEFGVLMEHCSVEQAGRVAESLRQAVEDFRFRWEDKLFRIGVSIGLVPITESSSSMHDLLGLADRVCYQAKDAGRNRIVVFQEDDRQFHQRSGETQWVARIREALEHNQFQLYYQSIEALGDGPESGWHCELLLRLLDQTGNLIAPGLFLPAAERYNLSTDIDRWVITEAFNWLSALPQAKHPVLCAINLSGHSLSDEHFLTFICQQLDRLDLSTGKICFEITETAAITNLTSASQFIHTLKQRGCLFTLDDFGSGLSSFGYLKNLPVDFLKIDGIFVKDIVDDPVDFAMVKSIHEIGRVMGKKTIAEFVENNAILEKLREIGVDYVQGYAIAMPEPLRIAIAPPQRQEDRWALQKSEGARDLLH